MATPNTRSGQRITAIACLGKGVRAKAKSSFSFDDLVDHGFLVPFIEVVHELSALVTEKSSVLKANRTFHAPHASETSRHTSDLSDHIIGRSNWPYGTDGVKVLQMGIDDFNNVDVVKQFDLRFTRNSQQVSDQRLIRNDEWGSDVLSLVHDSIGGESLSM